MRIARLSALLLITAAVELRAQPKTARLDEYLTRRAALGQFNGSVLVAQNGTVLLEKGYGIADVEHRVPISASTRFEVASLTKAFTAAAILRLQQDGRLTTRDSLCKWIEPCADAWRPVVIGQMLHHTSGIPDYESALDLGSPAYMDFMSQAGSAERIITQARTKPLDFPPGSKFTYSNTAYILLAKVIEKASGQPFRDYLRQNILAPAHLDRTTFASTSDIIADLANGYERTDFDFAHAQAGLRLDEHSLKRIPLLPLDGPHGDGNLVATAGDLWRWTEALADSQVLSRASVREMLTPGIGNYGTGWFVGTRFGRRTATHLGAIPGFASMIEWYPDSRSTIILLSNVVGIRQSNIMRDIAAILGDQPADMPVARRLVPYDSAAAAGLSGEYQLADGSKAIITAEKTMLGVKIPDRFEAGAFPMQNDEFYAPFFDNTLRFVRDAGGKGMRVVLRINGADLVGTKNPPR